MMNITGLSHLFKWENLHNWWLTKYFFAPLYMYNTKHSSNLSTYLLTLHMCKMIIKLDLEYCLCTMHISYY